MRDLALDGRSLREHTARGTIINAAFSAGLGVLGLLRAWVVAAFLTAADYGVWGIILASFATLVWLKQVGISDRYVQQDDADQEEAFRRAFTLEALVNVLFGLLVLAALPLVVAAYGRAEVIAPTLALLALLPAQTLQTPLWVFFRRMQFVRQRSLQAVDPVVAFAVTVALAVAGTGYWAFVGGALAGAYAGAAAAVAASPYKLAWRYDRGTLRDYVGFSGPLFVAGLAGTLTAQGAILAANHTVGLAGVGAIALAASLTEFTHRVDVIVTQTIYPAVCAVRERVDLLHETFVKSNRLTLMWGVPFGVGVALFAADAVEYVLGARWEHAVGLLQVMALAAAANHVGFNWHAFYRARGDTRPLAVAAVASLAVFCAVSLPLLIAKGLPGFAIGVAVLSAAGLVLRGFYLARLFRGFALARHAARALAPSVPAVAVVLAARALVEPRSLAVAAAELVAYALVTVGATVRLEGALLREVLGYLAAGRPRPASPAPA